VSSISGSSFSKRDDEKGSQWMIPLALFALALFARLYRLSNLDVWFDEVAIIFQTQMPWMAIWDFCKSENFPPLYPWLLKLWKTFGDSDAWLRLLSALIGSLIPPAAYLLGRELQNRRLGILLGLACVFSLPLYYYSQTIRMYSLFVLLACLSYYSFLKALRDPQWKYWVWMALANLLGFYSFLFMIFIMAAECLVLSWFYRLEIRKYFRPLLAHVPAFALMSLWAITLITRYQLQQSYVSDHLKFKDLVELWIYFGTGHKIPYQPVLMILLNLPFLLGLIWSLRKWRSTPAISATVMIAALAMMMVAALSILGQSIFGWLNLRRSLWRRAGLAWMFGALLISQGYCWVRPLEVHDAFRYLGAYKTPADDDGKSMSRVAALLQNRIQPGDAIIHYSLFSLGSFSYFDFLHFHRRKLAEYLYAAKEIPIYCGRPYLQPGEHISSLADLPHPPAGIWVVSLSSADLLILGSAHYQKAAAAIAEQGDLAADLARRHYQWQESFRDGAVSVAHFRRIPDKGFDEAGR
jgi:hypothetical protein